MLISDLHLHADGLHFGIVDTRQRLADALTYLHDLTRRPDLILATGDLADTAEPGAYAHLRDLVDPSEIPVLLLPGNHDEREPMVAAFPHHSYLPSPDGPLHYAVDDHAVRIVAVDTTVPGHQHGQFGETDEAWLDDTLAAAPDRPTLVALHHPPFETGIWWMDQICLHGADRVERVVRRHPQVRLVVAGHLHRPIQTAWGDTLVSVCPSSGLEVGLDLEPESAPTFVTESPQLALHLVDERGAVTHHVQFLGPGQLLRYTDQFPDWPSVREFLRQRGAMAKGGVLG